MVEPKKQASLNSYSELPVRAAVVWDTWADADGGCADSHEEVGCVRPSLYLCRGLKHE